MCKYCKPIHKTSAGELSHGDELINDDGINANGGISACIWVDKTINIETPIDNLYAVIKIKYCPMCGSKLTDQVHCHNDDVIDPRD